MPDRPLVDHDDDDIEFLYSNADSAKCQLCLDCLDHLTIREREEHYALHFAASESTTPSGGQQEPAKTKPRYTPSKIKFSAKAVSRAASKSLKTLKDIVPYKYKPEENIFWYSLHASRPPSNFTPGLIPLLKRSLSRTHPHFTARAFLCHAGITFINQEKFDKWWGCGYRNFLMACTALICQQYQPEYFSLLDDSQAPPGLRNLQKTIEAAWEEGYDPEGAKHYGKSLYGTKEWIGTAELYVAFTSKGIPARLVDFPNSPGSPDAIDRVSRWIVNYFNPPGKDKSQHPTPKSAFDAMTNTHPITLTDRMPVILQNKGHSRMVVGYELTRSGNVNLLVFDPGRPLPEDVRQLALTSRETQTHISSPSGLSSSSNASGSNTLKVTKPLESTPSTSKRRRSEPPSAKNSSEGTTIGNGLENIDRPVKPVKRLRGSAIGSEDIIIIDDDENDEVAQRHDHKSSLGDVLKRKQPPHEPTAGPPKGAKWDPSRFLSPFRVNIERLRKYDQYQLLWFPMTEPLNEAQKRDRRVVTSDRFDL